MRFWRRTGTWYQYEIAVKYDSAAKKDLYVVRLGAEGAPLTQTTRFLNADATRALSPAKDSTYGYIGLQSYSGSPVAFKEISVDF